MGKKYEKTQAQIASIGSYSHKKIVTITKASTHGIILERTFGALGWKAKQR